MQELVDFALRAIAVEPDQVSLNVVEGKASLLFEVEVGDEDRRRLQADDRALLASVQAVLSAASGRQKAVLDLIDPAAVSEEE